MHKMCYMCTIKYYLYQKVWNCINWNNIVIPRGEFPNWNMPIKKNNNAIIFILEIKQITLMTKYNQKKHWDSDSRMIATKE